jgi:5-oxoprolinase (ATP-hydrolysing) subunit A
VTSIDLNCDMGESFGPWKLGDDEAIMPSITSANIACGAHAGDPNVMAATIRLARQYGVSVGAHPGYPDLAGFGRRPMKLTSDEVLNSLLYQLGALRAIARSEGVSLSHVKPHGALYNQACEDFGLASAIVTAIRRFSSSLPLIGLPNSQLENAARDGGIRFLREGFADRAYEPNGLLRNRSLEDAVLSAPDDAAAQALRLASGEVLAHDGTWLALEVDTLCIHGDTPGAANIARGVRQKLEAAHIEVTAPDRHDGTP